MYYFNHICKWPPNKLIQAAHIGKKSDELSEDDLELGPKRVGALINK